MHDDGKEKVVMMRKLKRGMVCVFNPIWEGDNKELGDKLIKRNKGVKVKIVRKSITSNHFVIERIDKQEFLPGNSDFGVKMGRIMPSELLPLSEKRMKFKL